MQKLKLELDELEVTSFEAEEAEKPQLDGVHGNTTVDACFPTIVRPRTCDC
ncbi:MAG TPA: hypothetical protein VF092_23230 [Longimicrobium sp.]